MDPFLAPVPSFNQVPGKSIQMFSHNPDKQTDVEGLNHSLLGGGNHKYNIIVNKHNLTCLCGCAGMLLMWPHVGANKP